MMTHFLIFPNCWWGRRRGRGGWLLWAFDPSYCSLPGGLQVSSMLSFHQMKRVDLIPWLVKDETEHEFPRSHLLMIRVLWSEWVLFHCASWHFLEWDSFVYSMKAITSLSHKAQWMKCGFIFYSLISYVVLDILPKQERRIKEKEKDYRR